MITVQHEACQTLYAFLNARDYKQYKTEQYNASTIKGFTTNSNLYWYRKTAFHLKEYHC